MLETEGLRTVQRKVLFDDDREPKTQKIEIKQRQRPRDIDENVWNSIPLMFRRKYYKKSRQLNPALVQRKTILPVPLVFSQLPREIQQELRDNKRPRPTLRTNIKTKNTIKNYFSAQ